MLRATVAWNEFVATSLGLVVSGASGRSAALVAFSLSQFLWHFS